ncbi:MULTISPECIES: hypothetical protein [Flavobacterium]|uniref:hypothetical protein n=1 Tax=Flavobacterium TaxID=237 RepID=UPI001183E1BB|nr:MULTISPECIES: hypothetical protein [Flavobacterium]MCR4030283.1 hypothetical protein [Flavobacterium panacis]
MREINPQQLADIIENNVGNAIAINELRNIILEEGAILVHNGNRIANISVNEENNYVLQIID